MAVATTKHLQVFARLNEDEERVLDTLRLCVGRAVGVDLTRSDVLRAGLRKLAGEYNVIYPDVQVTRQFNHKPRKAKAAPAPAVPKKRGRPFGSKKKVEATA